jgi:beta-lactamase class A
MTPLRHGWVFLLLALVGAPCQAGADSSTGAPAYLASIQPSPELQQFLDRTTDDLLSRDARLRQAKLRIALLDLSHGDPPRLAERSGYIPTYPASVVKFVYLMAAYKFQEEGRLSIDPELDEQLTEMIYHSSNQATQRVFARLTATEPGPELAPDAYREFRARRLVVKEWLTTLGVTDLHCVNPTYDGDGDLRGRDKQFLQDHTVGGGLPSRDGEFSNRQAMTAVGTAKLLALLATDRALTPEDSATVRRRMRRDPHEQLYLAPRIAGGATRVPDLEVFSKSGTWGPIYADAGIIKHVSGREFILVVFTEASPPYHGDFIANLTERAATHLLPTSP